MRDWIFYGAVVLFLILVITPTREGLVWVLKNWGGPVASGIKSVLHVIFRAHGNVLRNFLPRTRIFYEMDRERTSHSEEK